METDISGEVSFQDIDLDAPRSEYGKYLDMVCPYYISWGMTWNEFWFESLDRLHDYWQANQYGIERRNQEIWLQGLYIKAAVASALSNKSKYPPEPQRITEMTSAEKEEENKRKIEKLREVLNIHKEHWDMLHDEGVDLVGH